MIFNPKFLPTEFYELGSCYSCIEALQKYNLTIAILYESCFLYRVMVKMTDLLNGNSWLWDRGKFMNRRYLMQVKTVQGSIYIYKFL